ALGDDFFAALKIDLFSLQQLARQGRTLFRDDAFQPFLDLAHVPYVNCSVLLHGGCQSVNLYYFLWMFHFAAYAICKWVISLNRLPKRSVDLRKIAGDNIFCEAPSKALRATIFLSAR